MTMRRIRSLDEVTEADRGTSAAVGNFDGVHLGHQAVLDRARAESRPGGLSVLTFEPHPRQVFQPDSPPFRLMNADARAHRLEKLGVDILFEMPFDAALRGLSADAFCGHVLNEGLGLTHVSVGSDFRYGNGREGDVATLRNSGAALGFGVSVAELVSAAPGAPRISSTAIRTALAEGIPRAAADMLGHWHRIEGPVQHGEKRGRQLGYPTANMGLGDLHLPRFGVYAVLVSVLDGPHRGHYHGAASLGVRPMFGENLPNLESFLFDFTGDLYGATLSVALVEYLRPEMKFDDLDALIARMQADCTEARRILAALPPAA